MELLYIHRTKTVKVLCTSDWHMGIYKDPCDALKLSNSQLTDMLDQWESENDLILLNGDIFEVLKSARIKFSHYDQTMRVIENRQRFVERIISSKKYLWVVGNHDYTLEKILDLPVKIKVELDHGFTLLAEHGHLLRVPQRTLFFLCLAFSPNVLHELVD
ncbi:MAG: metallophosphoesterase [Methylococcales bacterium]|nr:metallophosphoesterase [Methylococcales bacterium]